MNDQQQAPIVKRFQIFGLHGYKDVDLQFNSNVKVVIAENGSGKTTILSALNAFLRADFEKLRNLQFDSISCEFQKESLQLRRDQLQALPDINVDQNLAELASYSSVEPLELRSIISTLDLRRLPNSIQDQAALRDIYYTSPFDMTQMIERVYAIRSALDLSRPAELKALSEAIKNAVSRYEILYLPTYRRVELPLSRSSNRRNVDQGTPGAPPWRRQRTRPPSYWAGLGIQFGLADVDSRLTDLISDIQAQSNLGYRRISANIIDELLTVRAGAPQRSQLPDIDSLSLFFSRIEQSSDPEKRLNAIKELYATQEINSPDNSTLRYFLTKLSKVVEQTRGLEASIEQFVEKANTYLQMSSEEKKLRYDANKMKVLVQNLWTGAEVKLDDLSSGEKQVVSLLSHLYLYPQKKIVLIDEPELSLSIDWQKRLLQDVLGSPTCGQLLAITHSPFIFDNELDPYAGPMTIHRKKIST